MQFRTESTGGALAAFETGGINPVLMLSPGLLLLGAALALMRVAPPALDRLADVLARTRAPSWLLMGVQSPARSPGAAMLLTALIAFTTAVGLISATYAATIRDTEATRIRYDVGAQLRGVSIGGNLSNSTVSRVTEPLDSRGGVAQSSAAFRGIGSIGGDRSGSRVILLGLQVDRLDGLAALSAEHLGMPPQALREAIGREPGRSGQPLPEDAEALTVWARTDPDGANLDLYARLIDRHGRVRERLLTGKIGADWSPLRASLEGGEAALAHPLRLAAIIMRPRARVVRAPTGHLWLDDLAVETPRGSESVDGFEAGAPWLSALGESDRVAFDGADPQEGKAALVYRWTGLGANDERLLVRESPNLPVSAALDRESAAAADIGLGDVAPIVLANYTIPVRVTALVDYFPSLNPAQGGFVVVDLLALRAAALVASTQAVTPITEVWATTDDPAARLVAAKLMDDVYLSSTVLDAEASLTAAQEDPFRSGGIAALFVVGFLGLLAVGATTLILTLAAAGSERAREYALLQTLGYGRGAMLLQAFVEIALLLAIGVGVGFGLGRAVAGALLGFLNVTAEGVAAAPPTVLSVDWGVAGLGVGVLVVCGMVGVGLVGRWVGGRDVGKLLREGGQE